MYTQKAIIVKLLARELCKTLNDISCISMIQVLQTDIKLNQIA